MNDTGLLARRHLRRVLRIAVVAVGVYLAVLVVLLCLEDLLLYPAATYARPWRQQRPDLGARDVWLSASDGTAIHAWFAAPPGWRPDMGAVLYSHGNGSNLSQKQGDYRRWQLGLKRAVLTYDYPGYGHSGGRPSEAGCYAAAEAAYTYLVEQQKVPPGEVILVGSSLGSAMATELATRHEHRLLVLAGGFTSFPDMAQKTVPCYPSRWLVRNRLDNLGKISRVRGPVFIAHGTDDRCVPLWMAQRLFEKAPGPKRFYPIHSLGHQHPAHPAFFAAVRDFLDETAGKRSCIAWLLAAPGAQGTGPPGTVTPLAVHSRRKGLPTELATEKESARSSPPQIGEQESDVR
jgi:pimeloyl-ACP methyl ester carboxylesterase